MQNKLFLAILLAAVTLYGCKQNSITPNPNLLANSRSLNQSKSCVTLPSIEHQWNNTYTIIKNYTGTNTITKTNTIYPIGYFKINSNKTYNVLSNSVPLNGTWLIDSLNCQLTLDKGKSLQRSFNITLVTNDSLTIVRKDTINKLIYEQHYAIKITPPTCVRVSSIEYQWNNTYTEIATYHGKDSITSKSIIYPIGYFKINTNNTYNILSNGVPNNGKWLINSQNCQLTLDKGTASERSFVISTVTVDSLTITRKDTVNKIIYTQHYIKNIPPPTCVSLKSIEYQWNNTYTIIQYNNGRTNTIYPVGYFKLNTNNTYNVFSNGVPNNGKWLINSANCQLTLDKGTTSERLFSIDAVTTDSLTISRKDTINKVTYKQHYVKKH